MNFDEIARRRQSCRSFDSTRPAEPEAVERCLKAARLAPSAFNAQPYTMWVADGEVGKQVAEAHFAAMNKFIEDCPTFVVFTESSYNAGAKVGSIVTKQDYRSVDVGIAAAYLTAEATEIGLDTCIVGLFDDRKIRQILGTKEKVRLLIAIGHAKAGYALREKKRKEYDEIVRRPAPREPETDKKTKKAEKKAEKKAKRKDSE